MSQLLDGILKTCPGLVVEWFIEMVAKPMSEDIEEVEMSGDPVPVPV